MSILYTVFIEEEDGIHHFSRMFRDESDFYAYIASYPFPIHSWECHGEFEMNEKQDWIQVPLYLQVNRAVKEDCRKRLERMNRA